MQAGSEWTGLCISTHSASTHLGAATAAVAECRVLAHRIRWCSAKGAIKKKKKTQPTRKPLSSGGPQANVVLARKEDKNDPLFVGALHWLGAATAVLLLYRHFVSDVTASLTEVIPSTVT